MTAAPFLGLHPRTKLNCGKGPRARNQTLLDSADQQGTPGTSQFPSLSLEAPSEAHFRARFTQHLSSQIQAPLREDVLGKCRPKPALEPSDPQGPPTPADLLGVAHGLQDRMIQGLQGGQHVLVVPHVVHKVIWGKGRQGSQVIGGPCPSPWALPPIPSVPLIHCLSPVPSPHRKHTPAKPLSLHNQHLPHSSLVSTWLQRQRMRGTQRLACPVPPALLPSLAGTAQCGWENTSWASSLSTLCADTVTPALQVREQQVKDAAPSRGFHVCASVRPPHRASPPLSSPRACPPHQEPMGLNRGLGKARGTAHVYDRLSAELSRDIPACWVLGSAGGAGCPPCSHSRPGILLSFLRGGGTREGHPRRGRRRRRPQNADTAGQGAGGGALAADAKGPELCAGSDDLPFLGPVPSLRDAGLQSAPASSRGFWEKALQTLSWRFP